MAYTRKKKKVAKKAEAASDNGLVGCCFVIVDLGKKPVAEGDVQAMLRHDLYLIKRYGRDDKAPYMEVVSTDAFLAQPSAWLFFEDEDAMDEWLDENTPNEDEGDTANEPDAG